MAETITKTIHVRYFALLRQLSGAQTEEIQTQAATPTELYDTLRQKYGFHLEPYQLKVSINDAFSDWETPLNDGDSIVFIPPVAGG